MLLKTVGPHSKCPMDLFHYVDGTQRLDASVLLMDVSGSDWLSFHDITEGCRKQLSRCAIGRERQESQKQLRKRENDKTTSQKKEETVEAQTKEWAGRITGMRQQVRRRV